MNDSSTESVAAAFEILLGTIGDRIQQVSDIGAGAFQRRDMVQTRKALARAVQLAALREKIIGLRVEWKAVASSNRMAQGTGAESTPQTDAERVGRTRRDSRRLSDGQRAAESIYYLPILRVLDQMGGRGETAEVLRRVHTMVLPCLKSVDHEATSHNPEARWRNNAQWARNTMVHETGWLKKNTPRGIWEISKSGRRKLRKSK